jgi:hypothetical protein
MLQFIAILAANPLAGVAGFLVGLSLALCGYLGHTRPIRAGFNALCVFLFILLILCGLWFGMAVNEGSGFVAAFLAPFTGVLGFTAPVMVLWLDLRRANRKLTPTRLIPKWLRLPVFTIGMIIIFISLPGLLRFLIEFT